MSEDEDEEEEEDESELELLPLRRDGWVCVSTALGFSTVERRVNKSSFCILDTPDRGKKKEVYTLKSIVFLTIVHAVCKFLVAFT